MRFIAAITPELLQTLGSTEDCQARLLQLFEEALWSTTPVINQEQDIRVVIEEDNSVHIELDLNQRDAEVVKDIIYEALDAFFDPEFNADVEVEINTELRTHQ